MDWKKIKHFKREEFACKHCGACEMDEEFMLMLDAARGDAGVPFLVNSGYRCPEYDAKFGSKGNHTTGKAADIAVGGSRARYKILTSLIEAGFTRLGIAQNFIHADNCGTDEDKPVEVIWLY